MATALRIGELAAPSNVSPQTIRYYERLGLPPRPPRSPAGHRLYSDRDRERLRFIRRAQGVGLPLVQIRELVAVPDKADCGDLRARLRQVITARLHEIEERVKALRALRADMEKTLRLLDTTCEPLRGDGCGCPLRDGRCTSSPAIAGWPGVGPDR